MRFPFLLKKYVVLEFLPPFFLGLLVFTFLLVLNNLFLMMDLFLNRGVEIKIIFYMILLVVPMFLPLSIPMSALLAAMMSYGRLSEEGELTALKSSGCSLWQYSSPNIFLGLCLSLFLVFFNLQVAPQTSARFQQLYFALAQSSPLSLFAPKMMNHFGEYKIYVDEMDRRKKELKKISIYKINQDSAPTRIFSKEGHMINVPGQGLILDLNQGSLHQPNVKQESGYTITKFDRLSLLVPSQDDPQERKIAPKEMTQKLLLQKASQAANAKQAAPFLTEFHFRIAIAFAPLFFIILGIAIGSRVRRGSRGISIGSSLIIVLVYYGVMMFATSLATQGIASPMFLMWGANLIVFICGGFLYYKLYRQ